MLTDSPFLADAQRNGLALATAYIDALEHRDVAAISRLLAEDVVETLPLNVTGEATPWYVFTGKEQVLGYVGMIMQNFSHVRFADPVFTVSADGSVVFCEAHGDLVGTQGNKPYHNVYVFKWTLRDGHIVGLHEYANPIAYAKLMELPIG